LGTTIIADELETLKKSGFWNAEAYFFYIATKTMKLLVGLQRLLMGGGKWSKKNKTRFGWFDVIDDIEVTKALLEKVYELGRKNNLDMLKGLWVFKFR
jgi:hypothetical protein